MIATASPWAFHPHPASWIGLAGVAALSAGLAHRMRAAHREDQPGITLRQAISLGAGIACLAVAVTWPLADLAHRYCLLAKMGQNLVLSLVAPGLILTGLPRWFTADLTRPIAVYSTIRFLTLPPVAILIFNGTVIGVQTPPAIAAASRSYPVSDLVDLGLVLAGAVMWVPFLRIVPGAHPVSTAGRAGYLFVQSLLPNFVSLAYIFAKHPFYPVFANGARRLGLDPLLDQQLAGVLAKAVGVFVLWGAAVTVLFRASKAQEAGLDPDPLTWEDVDRELRRLERRHRHVEQD